MHFIIELICISILPLIYIDLVLRKKSHSQLVKTTRVALFLLMLILVISIFINNPVKEDP